MSKRVVFFLGLYIIVVLLGVFSVIHSAQRKDSGAGGGGKASPGSSSRFFSSLASASGLVHEDNFDIPHLKRNSSLPSPFMPRPAILVLCYNRASFLRRTLRSLMALPEVVHYDVYISQDGEDRNVELEAASWSQASPSLVHFWQKKRPVPAPSAPKTPPAGFVAQHYKWALDRLFVDEKHSHVIIVEDDMQVSSDFLLLFSKTAHLLDQDPTLMCVSSWNDNSRNGLGTNEGLLLRTSYFPGLGWMLKQSFYLEELQASWPLMSHWDNWLRANIEKDCISPSLPRNRNFGNIGSSMNVAAFSKEIAVVQFYEGKDPVDFGDVSYLLYDNYVKRMQELLESAQRLGELKVKVGGGSGSIYLLLYGDSSSYSSIAKFFKIWTHPRSHFQFLQMIEYNGDLYLVADVRMCTLLPETLRSLPHPQLTPVVAQQAVDCVRACEENNLVCSNKEMAWLNSCTELKKHFPCERGCLLESGKDIPSYVNGALPTRGFCVTKTRNELISCEGHHAGTKRLCACIPPQDF